MKQLERRYERRAELFKALANPLRLVMLEKLADKPWCVCALADELGVDKSIVSKYLSQLKSAGLIEDTASRLLCRRDHSGAKEKTSQRGIS